MCLSILWLLYGTYVSFECAKQMHIPVHVEVLHVSQETPKEKGLNMGCEGRWHHAIPTSPQAAILK